jgi:hypothetical protein
MGFLLYYLIRLVLKREFNFWPEIQERDNHLLLQNECLNEQFQVDLWRVASIWFGDALFWRNVFCVHNTVVEVDGDESDFED